MKALFSHANELEYSSSEFKKLIKHFVTTWKFKSFTIANFFEGFKREYILPVKFWVAELETARFNNDLDKVKELESFRTYKKDNVYYKSNYNLTDKGFEAVTNTITNEIDYRKLFIYITNLLNDIEYLQTKVKFLEIEKNELNEQLELSKFRTETPKV